MTLRPTCYLAFVLSLVGTGRAFGQTGANFGVPAGAVAGQDNLSLRFADGIVAIAEDKVITVDDVRREIQPLIPQIQREAHNEEEFNQKLEQLQDGVIQQLIDRVLIIRAFYDADKDHQRHIPDSFIDNYVSDRLADQFDNDRSKFLAYLRSRGETMKDYRKEAEEDIIYHYMQSQQRKSESVVSPVRIEQFYKENKDQFYQEDAVHLRLIQLGHPNGEPDDVLRARADAILTRLHAGEKFEDLAKEYSEDSRRSKGGDWGWQKKTDLKPEFSEPCFSLKKGQVTEPISTPDGCFILYVEDRRYAGIQPLDQVRDQIERILITQMTQSNMEHWLERLRRTGYVKHY
jgi:peptidyl-prolyl cis-trans isomerase SurA